MDRRNRLAFVAASVEVRHTHAAQPHRGHFQPLAQFSDFHNSPRHSTPTPFDDLTAVPSARSRSRLVAARAKRIDVDAAAPREARVDGQPFGPAAPPDVGEDPLDAMLVEARMPAERHEVAEQSRGVDPRAAVANLHAGVVGLPGHRAHRPEEARAQRLGPPSAPRRPALPGRARHRRRRSAGGRGSRPRAPRAAAREIPAAASVRRRPSRRSPLDRSRAERRAHRLRGSEARLVERGEVELDRLRLDDPRRFRGHRERRDRDLRLARGVEPGSSYAVHRSTPRNGNAAPNPSSARCGARSTANSSRGS